MRIYSQSRDGTTSEEKDTREALLRARKCSFLSLFLSERRSNVLSYRFEHANALESVSPPLANIVGCAPGDHLFAASRNFYARSPPRLFQTKLCNEILENINVHRLLFER